MVRHAHSALLVLRTSLEDRMLTTELPGYREYAKHVPERLVPACGDDRMYDLHHGLLAAGPIGAAGRAACD
jgi:hypothetical protein